MLVILGHKDVDSSRHSAPAISSFSTRPPDGGYCFYCNRAYPALFKILALVRRSGVMVEDSTPF